MSRVTPSYQLRLPAKDAPVLAAMQELSAQSPRYGYRRIRIFLRRQGFELSWVAHAPAVASGGIAGAQEASTQAHCFSASSHSHTVQGQHGLGL